MMQKAPTSPLCEVVILTALGLEYRAVRKHLQDPQEVIHQGTVYECGTFTGQHRIWRVAVAEIGMGGPTAAIETERAISYFQPQITLFVGVAGGLKDVKLGDVVAATKIYDYESGKAEQQFRPRPEVWRASHDLEQRARVEARRDQWLTRLGTSLPGSVPRVHIGPLAAGEKVLASTQADLFRLLKEIYGDALAVEMEGHGFLAAVHANHRIDALVIRGISDLIDGKSISDATGSQKVAAQHAAAFAFQTLANFTLPTSGSKLKKQWLALILSCLVVLAGVVGSLAFRSQFLSGSQSPTPTISSTSITGSPSGSSIQKPYKEQEGGDGANTFTNPYNLSGDGPKVEAGEWVEVSCKVYAPTIQSASPDGYWYRIASSPWNNAYYAIANTFLNGDILGHHPYTHNTDFNVPNC